MVSLWRRFFDFNFLKPKPSTCKLVGVKFHALVVKADVISFFLNLRECTSSLLSSKHLHFAFIAAKHL